MTVALIRLDYPRHIAVIRLGATNARAVIGAPDEAVGMGGVIRRGTPCLRPARSTLLDGALHGETELLDLQG